MKAKQDKSQKLLHTIDECLQGFNFSDILYRLKLEYSFKNLTKYVEDMSQNGTINSFVIVCYKLVIAKLIYDYNTQFQQLLVPNLLQKQILKQINEYAFKLSTVIKKQYCLLMQKISNRKSQTIQLVIFLISFSTKFVFSIFCKNFHVLRDYLLNQVQKSGDDIQTLACMLINYEITGIKLSSNSYLSLKKKYCAEIKCRKKQKTKTQLISNMIQFYPKSKKNQCQGNLDPCNQKQQVNQFKTIFFQQNSEQYQTKGFKNKKQMNDSIIKIQNHVSSEFEDYPIRIFGTTGFLKNSDAFKQNRTNFLMNNKSLNHKTVNNTKKQNRIAKDLLTYKKQKQKSKRDLTMAIITQSLTNFFLKTDKKNILKQNSKMTVAQWNKKIKYMQQEGGIQKVTFMKQDIKQRKGTQHNSNQQDIRDSQYFKKSTSSRITEHKKILYPQRRNPLREGFCEFIDQRQPNQMGILKSVVNFPAAAKQIYHRKTNSREIKLQYEEFIKNAQEHYERSLNQNNFVFRLQKALTGTSKM